MFDNGFPRRATRCRVRGGNGGLSREGRERPPTAIGNSVGLRVARGRTGRAAGRAEQGRDRRPPGDLRGGGSGSGWRSRESPAMP